MDNYHMGTIKFCIVFITVVSCNSHKICIYYNLIRKAKLSCSILFGVLKRKVVSENLPQKEDKFLKTGLTTVYTGIYKLDLDKNGSAIAEPESVDI